VAKTEMIRARVEPDLKRKAEELFSELGLSTTEAITLFYKQVTVHRGLPFDVRVPNAETLEALRQARDEDGLTEYTGMEDLKGRLD
jgi:DNA-damage-inducible protein J